MKNKQLLIIFAKNATLGKVKTRLASSIGKDLALKVYRSLLEHTETVSLDLCNADIHIYYTDTIVHDRWPEQEKFIQKGMDLGERMKNAFEDSFDRGYNRVIGIGTDLPDLSSDTLQTGLDALETHHTVFGPAKDGGYYLLGMNQMIPKIFENKPWSTETLLQETEKELIQLGYTVKRLQTMNDIDTIEDLKASRLSTFLD